MIAIIEIEHVAPSINFYADLVVAAVNNPEINSMLTHYNGRTQFIVRTNDATRKPRKTGMIP